MPPAPSSRRRRAAPLVSALLVAGVAVVVQGFLPPAARSSYYLPPLQQPQQRLLPSRVAAAAAATRLALWRGWGMGSGGNNATAAASLDAGGDEGAAGAGEGFGTDEMEIERLKASLLPEIVEDGEEAGAGAAAAAAAAGAAAAAAMAPADGSGNGSGKAAPVAVLTERALQQLDDSSFFDGFEGFRGRKVSYSSQPKARSNVVFEIWRARTPEDIAILYKGQHQYSASRRVQEAINEQVSTLLGMFLREPDFQSRLQIQGGQLANLFFKLQMLGYMFANADRVLSASSALNLRAVPRRPPLGDVSGVVAVSMSEGRNVTMQARDLLGNLVREVEALREELGRSKLNREVSRQSDLIAFIRSLPEEQQLALTQDAPDFTLDCMRKLVDLALARAIPTVGNQWNPTTPVLIPSKAIFAELCIMQVVTGYLLRATEEDQAQQLKVFGGLGGLP